VTTLVVSDLHLGAQTRTDVARRPELRAPLLEALDGVDHLVLLGDVLELRDGPREGAWIVADYLDVVLHVFTPDAREYYRLEDLWSDVPAVDVDAAAV
jgi:hypothetical protein